MPLIAMLTTPARAHPRSLALAYIVVNSVYVYLLNANTVIYTNLMAHDLFIFIDGAHRMVHGQRPHLDFTSGLGAANFYLTALLESFSKHLFQAFLWQNTLYIVAFMLMAYYVCVSRLTLFLSCLLLFYVIGLLGVPSNIGNGGEISTFAMFYNRFGWVALLLVFLLLIPAHQNTRRTYAADVLTVSFILIFCFYLKITYALAVLILLLLGLTFYYETLKYRAAGVLLVSVMIALLIELRLPGFTFAYVIDLAEMSKANGQIEFDIFSAIRKNIIAIVIVAASYFLVFTNTSLIHQGSMVKRFWLSLCFLLLCIFLMENNAQRSGLPALFALLCAYVMVCISAIKVPAGIQSKRYFSEERKLLVLYLLALSFSIPEFIERNGSLDRFYRYGKDVEFAAYAFEVPTRFEGLLIDEGSAELLMSKFEQKAAKLQLSLTDYRMLINLERPRQQIYQTEYAYTLANGSALLAAMIAEYGRGPVLTMDFANPYPYLLDLRPGKGDYLWFDSNKNISHDSYLEARQLFKDIHYIMEPKYAVSDRTFNLLVELYHPHIKENYSKITENGLWVVWKKKALPPKEVRLLLSPSVI